MSVKKPKILDYGEYLNVYFWSMCALLIKANIWKSFFDLGVIMVVVMMLMLMVAMLRNLCMKYLTIVRNSANIFPFWLEKQIYFPGFRYGLVNFWGMIFKFCFHVRISIHTGIVFYVTYRGFHPEKNASEKYERNEALSNKKDSETGLVDEWRYW